jgi:hypothetical protein
MKTLKILFLSILLPVLIVFLSCTGCESGLFNGDDKDNQDHTWEIQLNDNQKVIEQTVKGIEFKFCLLNEDSVPSTTFEEGENFYFYFTAKNTRDEDLSFDPDFMHFGMNTFCKVWNEKGDTIGKPFVFGGMDLIGSGAYPFHKGESYKFKFPWLYSYELWNSLFTYKEDMETWKLLYTYFDDTDQAPLTEGKYYTKFSHKFCFSRTFDEPSLYTDSLRFKINFEIK